VWCNALQCVAVCCRVLYCVAVCCSALQCDAKTLNGVSVLLWRCVAVCCSVLPCVAVCCSLAACCLPWLIHMCLRDMLGVYITEMTHSWVYHSAFDIWEYAYSYKRIPMYESFYGRLIQECTIAYSTYGNTQTHT